MKLRYKKPLALLSASIVAAGFSLATANAQQNSAMENAAKNPAMQNSTTNSAMPNSQNSAANTAAPLKHNNINDAQALVDQATGVVDTMKSDQQLAELMKKAKGIYIVPEFGRGAFILGARGGAGVVLVKTDKGWSDPAFYDFGAISVGAEAGVSGGSVAFLLMSQGAVDAFKNGNQVSLNTEAGLSILDYSANAQASWGKGDIIMWSDTGGAYAGATISVTDINWDGEKNRAFYGRNVDFADIVKGRVENAQADLLTNALPG